MFFECEIGNILEPMPMTQHRPVSLAKRIVIFAGGYGSGKTEVAVNYVRSLALSGLSPLSIIDLDIVNPYFRSRESTVPLTALGVRVIFPGGEQCTADLPIILPEIRGTIEHQQGRVVLDVGGDDVGARVLSSLVDAFTPDEYAMLLVLNANRPFTATIDGSIKMLQAIESSCRLKITGLVSNTHLIEETTEETILAGLALAREVGQRAGVPVCFVSAKRELLERIEPHKLDCEVLSLERFMLKPWEPRSDLGRNLRLV